MNTRSGKNRQGRRLKQYAKLALTLERALRREGYSRRKAHDIAFHLLDWMSELDTLYRLFNQSRKPSDPEIRKAVTDFLVHAPQHINAAKFLYGLGSPEDMFGLGYFSSKNKRRP